MWVHRLCLRRNLPCWYPQWWRALEGTHESSWQFVQPPSIPLCRSYGTMFVHRIRSKNPTKKSCIQRSGPLRKQGCCTKVGKTIRPETIHWYHLRLMTIGDYKPMLYYDWLLWIFINKLHLTTNLIYSLLWTLCWSFCWHIGTFFKGLWHHPTNWTRLKGHHAAWTVMVDELIKRCMISMHKYA